MDWRDVGIVVSVRRHGENAAIVEALTKDHGRHAGVVRGGTSRKLTPILQPGNELDLAWRARLSEHLGSYTVEPLRSRAGEIMENRLALSGLNSAMAILGAVLPEREPHSKVYHVTKSLVEVLGQEGWPIAYLHWELSILQDLGYGLDFSCCAATGATRDLAYVSPKTGRAVSLAGAQGFEDRLLPLPDISLDARKGDPLNVVPALQTTGHFLAKIVATLSNSDLPAPRERFLNQLDRDQS